ncbi:hypothetical protein [Mycoplasmopsis glycophila]|uniref:Uncharacterized protein n=1 Tax=Mycoplasmopsis glycophila TaxID=171285 RepID=A0A449AV95_9BACT|nr:hypothetical protein [Mycoplasmopsis glycophila]VEU70437.1 Uncharacterised protein [Mycoplasmopsis glycophila]
MSKNSFLTKEKLSFVDVTIGKLKKEYIKKYKHLLYEIYGYIWGVEAYHHSHDIVRYDFKYSSIIKQKISTELEIRQMIFDETQDQSERMKKYIEWAAGAHFNTVIPETPGWQIRFYHIWTPEELERLKMNLILILFGLKKDEREHLNIYMIPWFFLERIREILHNSKTPENAQKLVIELFKTTRIEKVITQDDFESLKALIKTFIK